jgi:hypothetical protein
MRCEFKTFALAAAALVLPAALHAQFDFKIADRTVQVHSFASQGFAYSNDNNYLTMKTSDGSFAMTDGGVTVSTQITDKFRVGAQAYDRNIGVMGKGRVTLDWALGDYKFKSWFGVRAGKVKTTLGLYNDTQDMEFLHTWAILPQSAYPLDLRASTIAHVGADVYGTFNLKRLGSLDYTGYVGSRPDDPTGGYTYGLKGLGINLSSLTGRQAGGDLRWSNLVKGVVFGASFLNSPEDGVGSITKSPLPLSPLTLHAQDNTATYYVQYKTGHLTLDGEYRRETLTGGEAIKFRPTMIINSTFSLDERGWYGAAAYRISKRLELGTYRSWFYPTWHGDQSAPSSHLIDQTVTARVDLARFWDLKIEGHFIDGYGSPQSIRGFYPSNNPSGMQPKTNMLVIRTGWNF